MLLTISHASHTSQLGLDVLDVDALKSKTKHTCSKFSTPTSSYTSSIGVYQKSSNKQIIDFSEKSSILTYFRDQEKKMHDYA